LNNNKKKAYFETFSRLHNYFHTQFSM